MKVFATSRRVVSDKVIGSNMETCRDANAFALPMVRQEFRFRPSDAVGTSAVQNTLPRSILMLQTIGPHAVKLILEDRQIWMMAKFVTAIRSLVEQHVLSNNRLQSERPRIVRVKQSWCGAERHASFWRRVNWV